MTPAQLIDRIAQRPLLLDGGLGSVFIAMGLEQGRAPETWIEEFPDRIVSAHRLYVEAGCDAIHTVTFGATPIKLAASGLEGRCRELNEKAVALAKQAAGTTVLVAGDIGPTGRFLPPVGDASEQELQDAFSEQVEALCKAGVDLISIETMYDLREAKAALRAARGSGLAVLCSITVEPKRKGVFTFMGDQLEPSLLALHAEGATAVGCNCSVTSQAMVSMVERAVAACPSIPIVAQPNAGQPITTPTGIRYDADPDQFAAHLCDMFSRGARILGGCCGTDDKFLRAARKALDCMTTEAP